MIHCSFGFGESSTSQSILFPSSHQGIESPHQLCVGVIYGGFEEKYDIPDVSDTQNILFIIISKKFNFIAFFGDFRYL